MNRVVFGQSGFHAALMRIALIAMFSSLYSLSVTADELSIKNQKLDMLKTLAEAKSELEGRTAEDALWRFWFDQAPSTKVRSKLDAAIERREAYDFEAAENLLDEVVALAPDYAEGYNQRAFIRFLRENFTASMSDLNRALVLEPDHFGALAGIYLIHSRQGETELAFEALEQAVILHPWLQERGGLPKSRWPLSYRKIHDPGQDI